MTTTPCVPCDCGGDCAEQNKPAVLVGLLLDQLSDAALLLDTGGEAARKMAAKIIRDEIETLRGRARR